MSAIAQLLLARMVPVSGSDREESGITRQLELLGARICIGHQAANVDGAGAVIVSTAITEDNPELAAARARSIPVWHRSQLLAHLCEPFQLIAISGTHGKTTTTGMVAQVLLDCALDPSVVIGGIFERIGSNARPGQGSFFVAEADESDRTHAQVRSCLAVITNIEADHLENYPGGMEQIRDNMAAFASNSELATILCQDDLGCRLIRPRLTGRVVTYGNKGSSPDADYTYESLPGLGMKVFEHGQAQGQVTLAIPGEHNRLNALAAVAVCRELGLSLSEIGKALEAFKGVDRRFQVLGQEDGITVVDDYAHHPTEVAATLAAADQYRKDLGLSGSGRQAPRRIVAVFQPHQPGRLRDMWDEFLGAFELADLVLVTDIYVARGKAIDGITSEKLAGSIRHKSVCYLPGKALDLPPAIVSYLQPGDLVLTIGAGDITKVGSEILRLLKQRHSHGTAR